jgi:hypothetical protein
MRRYLWRDGSFSWWVVVLAILSTLLLLLLDWYWRTHETHFF